jgi:hypothetical protein
MEIQMKHLSFFALCVVFSFMAPSSFAQQATCVKDFFGNPICSPPGGTILKDFFGDIICGRGQCVVDGLKNYQCAVSPGGGAIIDNLGQARCAGECESPKAEYCQIPQ